MSKIYLISSDPLTRQEITSKLNQCDPSVQFVAEAQSLAEAKAALNDLHVDAIFLDVDLSDGSAFEFLDFYPNAGWEVILMSGTPETAFKAFEYNALGFLLKPIALEQVKRVCEKLNRIEPSAKMSQQLQLLLRGSATKPMEKLILHLSEGIHILPLNETIRLESDGCYTSFFTSSGERIVVTRAIGEFDHLTENGPFFRVHQSHIVNLNFVRKVLKEDGGFVVLDTGAKVPIARRRKDEFFQCVIKHSAS